MLKIKLLGLSRIELRQNKNKFKTDGTPNTLHLSDNKHYVELKGEYPTDPDDEQSISRFAPKECYFDFRFQD